MNLCDHGFWDAKAAPAFVVELSGFRFLICKRGMTSLKCLTPCPAHSRSCIKITVPRSPIVLVKKARAV